MYDVIILHYILYMYVMMDPYKICIGIIGGPQFMLNYSLIRRTSVESARNLTPEKSEGGHKA